MLSSSFSTQGPTPTSNTSLLPGLGGSTPAAQALNNSPSAGINWNALTLTPANSNSANATSQTVTHPDGTTVKTNFDTGTSGGSSGSTGTTPGLLSTAQQPTYDAQGNAIIPTGGAQGTPVNPVNPNQSFTTPQAPTPTFPGLLSNLSQTASGANSPAPQYTSTLATNAQAGSPAATNYAAQTANYGAGNIPIGQNATNIASNYGQQIAQQIATGGQGVGLLTSGALNPVALGRAGAIEAAQNANIQQLEGQEAQALSANTQGLTAQQQAATAANEAAGQANTQYSTQLTGQANAASAANTTLNAEIAGQQGAAQVAQPSAQGFPFTYDPLTNSYTIDPAVQSQLSSGVQQAISNPALYTSLYNSINSTYGAATAGMFQQAYINAGGNPQTAAATGSSAASNVGTAATSQANAWNGIQQTALTNVSNYSTAQNNINLLGNSTIAALNALPTNIQNNPQFAGATLNSLATQFNSPEYASFNAQVAGLQRAISNYIQLGEIPTSATQTATSIVNGSMTVGSLEGALSGFDTDLTSAVNAAQTTATYAQNQLNQIGQSQSQGNNSSQSSGNATQTVTSSLGGSYQLVNGQWEYVSS